MNLLITGAAHFSEWQLHEIENIGFHVVFMQNESDALPIASQTIDAVICNALFLHHDIRTFTNLKYIQLTSAGYDRVPLEYIKEHNIQIYNARGVYSVPMAEFAISSVLQIYKQASFFTTNQKSHQWLKHRGLKELYGKTVCIVGCGSVGTECAKRFAAFECKVIGVDLDTSEKKYFEKIFSIAQLEQTISEADVIILTVPLTEDTKHLINGRVLEQVKEESILINIARGEIIETEALTRELNKRNIYAVLDVFENEPLEQKSMLWEMKNVIITPHNSFVGEMNRERLWGIVVKNLKNWSNQ